MVLGDLSRTAALSERIDLNLNFKILTIDRIMLRITLIAPRYALRSAAKWEPLRIFLAKNSRFLKFASFYFVVQGDKFAPKHVVLGNLSRYKVLFLAICFADIMWFEAIF